MTKRAVHLLPLFAALAVTAFGVELTWTWLVGDSKYLVGVAGAVLGIAGLSGLLLTIDGPH